MIATFSFQDFIEATNANIILSPANELDEYHLSTDTRSIKHGEVYLPLKGPTFDGHNFIQLAFDNGASGCFVEKKFNSSTINTKGGFIIEIEDSLLALLNLAKYYRQNLNALVIALTGSSGKTTTKELIFSVLSQSFFTQRSQMNYNNEIGVSKTLLDVDDETELVILEMGMRGLGEIDLLVKYSLPDIAIVTNVGCSHIGRLGSLENIATAKTEILKYLNKKDGIALLHADDELLLTYAAKVYKGKKILFGSKNDFQMKKCFENKMLFTYKDEEYELPIPGKHNIINASVAIELGKYFGMSYKSIYQGLKNYKPLFGRWEEYKVFNNSIIINDAYNSNPDSAKAAIDTVFSIYSGKKTWLVLGDMLELGEYEEKMHREIGNWLTDKSFETLVTVGKLANYFSQNLKKANAKIHNLENAEAAADFIFNEKPDDTVILLKASRGIGLEKIINKLNLKIGGDDN